MFAALLSPARPASGSPLQMFGSGGRSPGLAATGVAAADDFDCVYLNPAGLGELRRKRLSFGSLVGSFDLEGVDRGVEAAVGVQLGGVVPIPLGGVMRDRVGLGLGFYVPTTVLNRARAPMPGTPYYTLLESRAQVVGIQVGVGVRLGGGWSAGAGFLALAALVGHIHVSADAAGRFTSTSEEQLISHFAPIFGARRRLGPDLVLGATFRAPSRSAYDIRVTNDLGERLPLTLPELRIAGVAQYDPLTVAAEAAWRPNGGPWLLLGQLAYERWSAFPLPTENPVADMPDQEPPGFHDTVVPRIAAEWQGRRGILDVAARGGYFYVMTPAPEMTGQQAFLDNDRHVLSVGLGLATPRSSVPLHVDAWFQLHFLAPRTHDRPGDEPDVETSGAIYVGGLVVGVDL